MRPSRIQAVDHIHLEAAPEAADDLRWFYTEVAALEEVDGLDPVATGRLAFRSEKLEVRFRFVPRPLVEPNRRRMTVAVPSLAAAAALLAERGLGHARERGLLYTEERLHVLDPAGHRVELKQDWGLAGL
ncbi:MAG TPA: hypothetical protein PKK06_15830 [Phycisphaerae bacterium]|nr:hypothetical protein [Phycisphaerae bacterium]HNU47014.1 hypothetical protein [Phycisphaerae bacterium]